MAPDGRCPIFSARVPPGGRVNLCSPAQNCRRQNLCWPAPIRGAEPRTLREARLAFRPAADATPKSNSKTTTCAAARWEGAPSPRQDLSANHQAAPTHNAGNDRPPARAPFHNWRIWAAPRRPPEATRRTRRPCRPTSRGIHDSESCQPERDCRNAGRESFLHCFLMLPCSLPLARVRHRPKLRADVNHSASRAADSPQVDAILRPAYPPFVKN